MATWPSNLIYSIDHSFSSNPDVSQTESITRRTRLRLQRKNRDDKFNVELNLTSSELLTFETFAKANPDTFTGPYYDSDVEQTGTLRIVNGDYSYNLLSSNLWSVSFTIEVLNRQHTTGKSLYELAVSLGESYSDLGRTSRALEKAVNENKL